jgi:hypothetical protein
MCTFTHADRGFLPRPTSFTNMNCLWSAKSRWGGVYPNSLVFFYQSFYQVPRGLTSQYGITALVFSWGATCECMNTQETRYRPLSNGRRSGVGGSWVLIAVQRLTILTKIFHSFPPSFQAKATVASFQILSTELLDKSFCHSTPWSFNY